MKVFGVKTGPVKAGDDIFKILDEYLPEVNENSVIAITSKVVGICENRVVKIGGSVNKRDLIKSEAEFILDDGESNGSGIFLTVKEGILIPTAGIDESNGDGFYILYPKNPMGSAKYIWEYLATRSGIRNFGIILTDSKSSPLRRGTTGISISWCGLKPVYSYVGKPDIFGRELEVTSSNIIDGLAAAAVLVMGEGDELCPIAVLEDIPKAEFTGSPPSETEIASVKISLEEDIYAPLLRSAMKSKI